MSTPTKEQVDAAIAWLECEIKACEEVNLCLDEVSLNGLPAFVNHGRTILDALADARRRLEEMQADKERLDWLSDTSNTDHIDEALKFYYDNIILREAIDAAMAHERIDAARKGAGE